MRVIVCTKRDLAGALVLNDLMRHMAGCRVMVLLSDKTRPRENTVPELSEMKFFERDLAIDTLFPLIDRVGGDGAELATFAGISARTGTPIKVVTDINGPDSEALIRDFAPDVIVSARFSLIFKRHIFSIPRLGTWNVHPGALPRYAGLFAPFRCMAEGGDRIGCSLHRVDDGIDTGPLVGIGWLPIDRRRSLLWHVVNTYRPGLELLYRLLDDLRAGNPITEVEQDKTQRVYKSLPERDQFEAFLASGFRLFEPEEYLKIIAGFLPPGMDMPQEVSGAADRGVGAPCCCARA